MTRMNVSEQRIAEDLEYAVAERLLIAVGATPKERSQLRMKYGRRGLIATMIINGSGMEWAAEALALLRQEPAATCVATTKPESPSDSPPR